METKHTPGPWEALGTAVYSRSDNPCQEIVWQGHNTRHAPQDERLANAALIAAAPELLEALREAIDLADLAEIGDSIHTDIINHWRAIVKKALGATHA